MCLYVHICRGCQSWHFENPPWRECRASVVRFTGRRTALLGICLRAEPIFPSSHFPPKEICISEHANVL